MSLDVIICRNISFVGCILIVAVTELNKIFRSLFIALQWRRRCISSLISFNSHLVQIRWFIGVIGLLYRPLSIFRSCETNKNPIHVFLPKSYNGILGFLTYLPVNVDMYCLTSFRSIWSAWCITLSEHTNLASSCVLMFTSKIGSAGF